MQRMWLLSLLLLMFFPYYVRAADPTLVISEVAWAGSSASNADEWVELYNSTEGELDISGWFLEGAGSGGVALEFPEGSTVSASGTFLIANYDNESEKSTLYVTPDLVTTSVALSNSSLHLILRDSEGNLIDEAGSGSAPPAGHSGDIKASMSRVFPVIAGGDPASWKTSEESFGFDASATELGTPGQVIITDQVEEGAVDPTLDETDEPSTDSNQNAIKPDPLNTAVRISEVYPSPPTGEKEWIELVNPSSIGQIIDNWSIEDGRGTSTMLSGLILPWSRVVIESPKGSLNNSGDLVLLRDNRGRSVDGLTYGKWEDGRFPHKPAPKRGHSVMRVGQPEDQVAQYQEFHPP